MVGSQSADTKRSALLIAGPTASGKSALALTLATQMPNPVIINTDSMQVYRDLDILTARPSQAEMETTPHALFGSVDGASAYSTARWRDDVRGILAENPTANPIFVGGTGLYFKVLLEGLAPVPEIDPGIRADVRKRCEGEGSIALHAELDEETAAQLNPGDSQRVSRALEVLLSTGLPLAEWHKMQPDGGLVHLEPERAFALQPDKSWLETRIAARADVMFETGALAEVQRLIERSLCDDLPVMRALGVASLRAYLDGALSREDALSDLVIQTRRYAKRQMTWFRQYMKAWTWLEADGVRDRVPSIWAE